MQRDKIPTTKKKDKLIGHTNFVQHYNLKYGNLSTLATSRSTLNFIISDSGVQESRHSPLRDVQPQSCGLGTEMLGTSAC